MTFVISSLQHPLVKHLVKLRTNSDYRYAENSLLLEGSKPISEVLPHVKKLIYTENCLPIDAPRVESFLVTQAVMQKISGLVSPEGVIAEVELPLLKVQKVYQRLLVLDGISDPGNMGTLLRTALAFGWCGIFVLPGCCDLFNEKVLRAARGAHFKLSLFQGNFHELKHILQQQQLFPLLADIRGQKPEKFLSITKKALIMGNEAHGASQEVREICTPITLAMSNQMESLNVAIAGGILLYLLKN